MWFVNLENLLLIIIIIIFLIFQYFDHIIDIESNYKFDDRLFGYPHYYYYSIWCIIILILNKAVLDNLKKDILNYFKMTYLL